MTQPSTDKPALPLNLCNIGMPFKFLFTGYLSAIAIGYLMALIQILFTHGMADGKVGLSIEDIVYSYYGNRSGTVLEQKLNGSMKMNASDEDRFKIIQWVRDDAPKAEFDKEIKPIIERDCIMCHNEHASSLPNFKDFAAIKKLTKQDHGISYASLTRISHIHLFGISFIFMFVGGIFSLTTIGHHRYIKYTAIIMPFLFLLLDISSWWLTKLSPHFAWLVIIGGAGLGISFAYMWLTSMYQMWFLSRKLGHSDRRNAMFR